MSFLLQSCSVKELEVDVYETSAEGNLLKK
jgi:hypothetical protein